MRTVITYGTFDLFHYGHVRLLKRARLLGDCLVVGLSTDEFNNIKGKTAQMTYMERHELLSSCRYVDEIFEEKCWEQKESDILAFKANVFVMGDDWRGKFDFLLPLCDVVYLPRTPEVSSTELRAFRRAVAPRAAWS